MSVSFVFLATTAVRRGRSDSAICIPSRPGAGHAKGIPGSHSGLVADYYQVTGETVRMVLQKITIDSRRRVVSTGDNLGHVTHFVAKQQGIGQVLSL
jgi:hypothetical protein